MNKIIKENNDYNNKNFKKKIYFLILLIFVSAIIYNYFFKINYRTYKIDPFKKDYIEERTKLFKVWLFNNYRDFGETFNDNFHLKKKELIYEKGDIDSFINGFQILLNIYNLNKDRETLKLITKLKPKIYLTSLNENLNPHQKAEYIFIIKEIKDLNLGLSSDEVKLAKRFVEEFMNNNLSNNLKENADLGYAMIIYYNYFEKDNRILEFVQNFFSEYYDKNLEDIFIDNKDTIHWHLLFLSEIYKINSDPDWYYYIETIVNEMMDYRSNNGVCFKRGCIVDFNINECNYINGLYAIYNIVKVNNIKLSLKITEYIIKSGKEILKWQILDGNDDKLISFQLNGKDKYFVIGAFCNFEDCRFINLENNKIVSNTLISLKKFNFA